MKLCYEPLLPINTKHKKVKQFSIRNADLRYTCRKTRTTKFCGRWMNNTKFSFETEFKKISSSNMKINTVSLQTLPMTSWYLTQGDLKHRVWYTSECTEGRGKKTCLTTCVISCLFPFILPFKPNNLLLLSLGDLIFHYMTLFGLIKPQNHQSKSHFISVVGQEAAGRHHWGFVPNVVHPHCPSPATETWEGKASPSEALLVPLSGDQIRQCK